MNEDQFDTPQPAPAAPPAPETPLPTALPTPAKKEDTITKRVLGTVLVKTRELGALAILGWAIWYLNWYIPRVQPTAGVDIWGSIGAAAPVFLFASLSWFQVWLMNVSVFRPLRDADEKALMDRILNGGPGARASLGLLAIDTARMLIPFYWILKFAVGGK